MSFKEFNLDSNIYKAIQACKFTTPTPVQAKAVPVILGGSDLVATAQTGTGKTAAFVLPALQFLSQQPANKKTRILILTPTRELARQITEAAAALGKFLRFNIVSLVGGMPYHHQIKDLARGADVIVATPGRLLDHMEQKRVDLSQVAMLVLDEADRMLDMGFTEDVHTIAKKTPKERQTLLFSATIDKEITSIVRHLLKNPVRIDVSNEKISAPKITQEVVKANNPHHKMRLLRHFLNDKHIFKAIIFSATKVNADRLANQLREEGYSAAALHGDLRQNVRNRTLEQLRRGKIQFLVATDVAARGIDVSDITHVINYDLPKFCEDYVHRIGRTGRAGKSGIAISFVLPTESQALRRIERYIGQHLKLNMVTEMNTTAPTRPAVHEHKSSDYTEKRKPFAAHEKNTKRKFKKREGEYSAHRGDKHKSNHAKKEFSRHEKSASDSKHAAHHQEKSSFKKSGFKKKFRHKKASHQSRERHAG